MGKTSIEFTMSLDGFIADSNDDVSKLFKWYYSGDVDFPVVGTNIVFKISQASSDLLTREWSKLGGIVTGRRDFDVSKAWGGTPPLEIPTFIVTHNPPEEWKDKQPLFHFVTDGVESAIEQAKAAAGDKDVGVSGSKIVQQALNLGLIDEIHIHVASILLGDGVRLFDELASAPIELEQIRTIVGKDVTHLIFDVVK